jgi:hemerythrin superfamily protein
MDRRETSNRGKAAQELGMAKAKSKARKESESQDAIDLLESDHREVEALFEEFESSESQEGKRELAAQICEALTVHAEIEEEIFYPAFIEATEEEDIHHEAVIEHLGAKRLIADIEEAPDDDEYFDA